MYSKVTHLHRSILLAANGSISFVFMANIPLCLHMHASFKTNYLLALGSFVNSAAMNIEEDVSFQIRVFILLGCTPRSGIAGSCGSSIFSFLKIAFILLSIMTIPIYIPTNCVGGFPFLHTLFIYKPFDDNRLI